MAKFTEGQPAASSALSSQVVRDNLDALFQMDQKSLRVRAQSTPNMTVQVAADQDTAYVNGLAPLNYAGGNSPTLTAPAGNNRLDVLTIDKDGTLAWTSGTEAASPTEPSITAGKMALATIFSRVGAASIKNTDDGSNAYIQKDRRPFLNLAGGLSVLDKVTSDTTVGNTVTETNLYSKSVDGGLLGTNNMLRLTIIVTDYDQDIAANDSFTLRLKYGATTVATLVIGGADATAITNRSGRITALLAGNGATNSQQGEIEICLTAEADFTPANESSQATSGTAAEDSTAAKTLAVTAQWGTTNVADTITIGYAMLELLQ